MRSTALARRSTVRRAVSRPPQPPWVRPSQGYRSRRRPVASADVVSPPDGGPAPYPLSVAPPDTTGYTTYSIPEADSTRSTTSILRILLNDATDYVIDQQWPINRAVRLEGGRNIVWMGAHIRLSHRGWFPGGAWSRCLYVLDGPAAVDRIIHLEGMWFEGDDVMEGIDWQCPHAQCYVGYMRIERDFVRSSDLFAANATDGNGTQMYQGVNRQHPDGMQDFGGHRGLTFERCTIITAETGFRFDESVQRVDSDNKLKHCNIKAEALLAKEEGPLGTATQSWSSLTARASFESTQDGFTAAVNGATLTWPYTASPLSGTQSLQVSKASTTTVEIGASRTFASATDWSNGGAANALSCLVRIDAGGGAYPMMRIDITEDGSALTSDFLGWHYGQAQPVTPGVVTRLVSQFPADLLATLRKVRVVLITDGKVATHTFVVDDIASGTGSNLPSFTGPAITYAGKWGIYHDRAGKLYMDDVWCSVHPQNLWKRSSYGSGQNYTNRYWDPTANAGAGGYLLDPPPGNATHIDFFFPTPLATASDATGTYATWDSTYPKLLNADGTGPAKVYAGDPPGGDFCPRGVAGLDYSSPSQYIADPVPVDGAADTLKWDLAAAVDASVERLKWDLAAAANASAERLLWDLRITADAGALRAVWDTRAAADGIVLDLLWDLVAQVNAPTRSLLWDVIAQLSSSAETLKWDLAAQLNAGALRALWDLVAQANASQLRAAWDLRSEADATAVRLPWDVRAAADAAALRAVWDLRAAVDATALRVLWDLVARVNGASRTLVWDLVAQVARAETFVWDLRAQADAAAAALVWDLRARADAAARALLWDLAAEANGAARRFVWDVVAQVAATETLLWDLIAAVNSDALELIWDLQTQGQVNAAPLPLVWDVIARADADAARLVWDTRAALDGLLLRLPWDLRAAVGTLLRLPWDLRAERAGAVLRVRWDLRLAVTAAHVALGWDDRASVDAAARGLLWDLAAEVVRTTTLRWDLAAERERALGLRWDLRASADAAALALAWDLVGRAELALRLRWAIEVGEPHLVPSPEPTATASREPILTTADEP